MMISVYSQLFIIIFLHLYILNLFLYEGTVIIVHGWIATKIEFVISLQPTWVIDMFREHIRDQTDLL